MRAVVQRVSRAEVWENGVILGRIGRGFVVLLAVGKDDEESDLDYVFNKVVNVRIFEDELGKMNQSLVEVGGQLLVVSQFTLYGDCRKGRRPSFMDAAPPDKAEAFYERFIERAKQTGIVVSSGRFQSMMDVHLVNSGPVTILLDSKKSF